MTKAGLGLVLLASLGVASAGCAQVLGIEDWEPAAGGGGTGASGGGGDPSAGGGGTDTGGPTTTSTSTSTGTGTGELLCGQASLEKDYACECSACKPNDTGKCYDSCRNGEKDLEESDLDCGGPFCKRCEVNKFCKQDCDCDSRKCFLKKCVAPTPDASPCTGSCGTSN